MNVIDGFLGVPEPEIWGDPHLIAMVGWYIVPVT